MIKSISLIKRVPTSKSKQYKSSSPVIESDYDDTRKLFWINLNDIEEQFNILTSSNSQLHLDK